MTPAGPFLGGIYEVTSNAIEDHRGSFSRLFCEAQMSAIRSNLHFTQVNLSKTHRRGTVRGMHFQRAPAAEAKLIRCLRGSIFDVAVDLRQGSPSFLHWHGAVLSADNNRSLFIPEGFAHGFQAMTDDVQLLYMHTADWTADAEGGLRHDDPRLAIQWPLEADNVSQRDRMHPLISDDFVGIET